MIMFGITTFMFALGIIALVLETTISFQTAAPIADLSTYRTHYYVWATVTCLMVRFHDAFMQSA